MDNFGKICAIFIPTSGHTDNDFPTKINFYFEGMGYDESQYSLPRWMDLSVSRQGMFDDTYHYIPSQGWMFLPLVVYHAGGDAAKFEPLSQNIKVWLLIILLSYNLACFGIIASLNDHSCYTLFNPLHEMCTLLEFLTETQLSPIVTHAVGLWLCWISKTVPIYNLKLFFP